MVLDSVALGFIQGVGSSPANSIWITTPRVVIGPLDSVEADVQSQLWDSIGEANPRKRAWLFELSPNGAELITEWVVVPTRMRMTRIDQATGKKETRFAEELGAKPACNELSAPSISSVPNDILKWCRGERENPLFFGVYQVYRPDAQAAFLPPALVSIGWDREKVTRDIEELYQSHNSLSNLFYANYWVMEPREYWGIGECEHWITAPDDQLLIDVDHDTGEVRNARTGELLSRIDRDSEVDDGIELDFD